MPESWEDVAKAKRDSISALIPEEWRIKDPSSRDDQVDVTGKYIQSFLSSTEVEITETDAADIARNVAARTWKAVDVIKAFSHRAALAHQLTNCLLEIFFDEGIKEAQDLDEFQAKNGKTIGPLHGVPVSLKDQFHVRGVETSMGYVGWLGTFQGQKNTGREKQFESEMVKELRECGAVLYCKTSVPHTLMTGETINNIMGYCWNPRNRHLSAGGSSGGEGALIGARGSPLGFGTDIGGSIRIPAAVNGLYGIRPSAGRMPYEGMANSMDGQNTILSVVGPLATSIGSLRLAMQALLGREPWLRDPLVIELPWRSEQENVIRELASQTTGSGGLAFGVLRHDGACTPHPPMARALDMAVDALERLGHQVIEWKPPSHEKLGEIALRSWIYDGGKEVRDTFALSGEPMSAQIAMFKETRDESSATHIQTTNIMKREAQKEYMEYWNSTSEQTKTKRPVDAVICPVTPFAAARPEKHLYVGYSLWANLLDYSAVTVPITQCDKSKDPVDKTVQPVSDMDRTIHESYDPEIYDEAHVSVQLVGRRLQEEKMLALAEVLDGAIKGGDKS